MKAPDFCTKAADLMADRGKERDNEGERSMARCVHTFNAMTGFNLSVEDGWLFMVYLKHARMRGGCFKQDDYEDAVAYEALMAEEALEASIPEATFKVPDGFFDPPAPVALYSEDKCEDCATCKNTNCPRR